MTDGTLTVLFPPSRLPGTLNQENWAKKFPSCTNAKQSPINIEENLAQVKLRYQKLRFDGWDSLTTDRTTIKNDGKTVAVNVDGEFYVSGGGLWSKFKVGRITFHWGRCNASSDGSEHSLDGVKYPLEMQIYCYEAHHFDSLDESIRAGGRITALAVLFEVTEENENYAAIVDGITSVSRYGKSAEVLPFALRGLLPNSTDKYFIYNGSLTTPPCSETVEWIVFKNTVAISDEQLEMFCEVMTMQQAGYVMLMDYLQNNYREQQDQFMGQVFSSYTGVEEVLTPVCSSEPENIQALPYNLSSLLVTWERPRAVYDANIERYSVTYRLADAENVAPSEYLTDGDQDVGAILDDLLANNSYVVQVVALCTNGLYGRVSDLYNADFSGNAPFYYTTTTKEVFISTSTPPLFSSSETDDVLGGIGPDDGVSTTTPSYTSAESKGGKSILSYSTSTTTLRSHSTEITSTTTSSSFIQAETNQVLAHPMNEDTTPELRGLPEIQTSTTQPSFTSEADSRRPTSSSMPQVSSTTASVRLSGVLFQTTQPLSNGERPSVLPSSSSSSFTSSPLCDTADPSASPSTCLHDPPSSSWPVLSTSASDSKHAATALLSSKDPASPSTPTLPSSTLPHLPQPSLPLSGWDTQTVLPGGGFDDNDSDAELLSGSSSSSVSSGDLSVFIDTPPLQMVPHPSGTTVAAEPSDSSWDSSLSTMSLSISPTLQPSVFFSSDFTLVGTTPGLSHSFSLGFEDPSYATGSTIESFLSEVSGDGFPLASNVDALCGCSQEPSAPSSWLHASPHVPLPSSTWDSASLELYSSVGFPSSSGVGIDNLPHSLSVAGPHGPSSDQLLLSNSAISPSLSTPHSHIPKATHSDLPISVAATAPGVRDPSFSASDGNSALHASAFPSSPTASPFTPTPEGQALETSSSASGSAVFPESQEDIDQEWDRVQSSAFEESALPYSTEVTNTVSPTTPPDQSGQASDDLDERSSAFYFESESGSAITSEVGGTTTPTIPVVTSASSWSLGGEEESGSGQGESLYDNETSSDFRQSLHTDLINEISAASVTVEINLQFSFLSLYSAASLTSILSYSFSPDASNSSHESRVGSIRERERKAVVPLAVISTLTVIGMMVLISILIYWRTCFQTAHFYIDDSSSPRVIAAPTALTFSFPVKDFVKHVAELHSTLGFQQEFEEVQSCSVDMGVTTDSSNHPDNKTKNRYSNILAYDHSRVRLSPQADKDGKPRDYINANYVDGFKKTRSYIAAQGPLRSSTDDFWRMIWEQNVSVIVMITNLMEKGRRKCDQYWPTEVQEEYGSFLVTVKSSRVLAYYTQRTFTVRNTHAKKGSQKGQSNERTVMHYHYTQWPDMGVPEFALPLLSFVRKSSRARTEEIGPVVVHCSAGVGRTGTYIVLDSMLKQMSSEGTINITGFLKHIRTQRNYLVQTEEQYVFIHDALVEAILSGETEVLAAHLHRYVDELLTPGPGGRTRLDKQHFYNLASTSCFTNRCLVFLPQLVCHTGVKQCDYSAALQDCNRSKNRNSSVIPVERSRVRLSVLAGETSDYINASYITGYRQRNEFIITQNPLPDTVKDFWRMIWDHNSQVIVSLPGEEQCVFWPRKGQPISYEMFTVTQRSEDHVCLANEDMLVVQEYVLEATQDDYVLEVKHYRAPHWPNPDSPISNIFELLNLVKEESAAKDGPIVAHDDVGGVTAGTFCALLSLTRQLEAEGSVDVFQVAKLTNLMRPGVFSDTEQYQFLYKAMLSLIGTQEDEKTLESYNNGTIVVGTASTAESLESLV
uniref:protein-tyrosine-phosphatase n=1 Tax=Anabas testudineus TaxID=64144 RepID=A0A7N6BCS1_ANATE